MADRARRLTLRDTLARLKTPALVVVLLSALPPLALLIAASIQHLPPELSTRPPEQSIRIEDRDGHLLREVRSASGTVSQWVPLASMPPELTKALVSTEDRRFALHPGVDPLALLRATSQALVHRRIVSGASTLTMQLARALRPHPRTLSGKFWEMALALRLEASLSKPRILEQYLNRVDFGPNLRGIGAASQGYFGKSVSALSVGEMALLVGLLKGPSVYALDRHPERALGRRNRVLSRMLAAKVASQPVIERARSEPLLVDKRRPAFGAPHFVSALLQGQMSAFQWGLDGTQTKRASRIRTTIDPVLQRATETAVSSIVATLRAHHVSAAAALVVNTASGDVLAYVGSPDFYDPHGQGQVDGVRARRQPGSTLKPFVYAAAFEHLGYTAATVLPDLALSLNTEIGVYSPRNFDDKFRGPVRLREALGNSLNVPAVYTAAQLGAGTLLRSLHAFGFDSLNQKPEYYGPALALGDGEVTLIELVRAYATLARGGLALPLRVVLEQEFVNQGPNGVVRETRSFALPADTRVTSAATAAVITDILKDQTARLAAFGAVSPLQFDFDVAAKTGTSKGFRDNWVIGYSHRFAVGVWVGNFDGSSMQQVSGITGAGPLFHAILDAAMAEASDAGLPIANGVYDNQSNLERLGLERVPICPISGEAIGPDCPHAIFEFIPSNVAVPSCQWHQTLAIDRRNGLLAGPSCAESNIVRQRFEIFPPMFAVWAKASGHALPPERYSPDCPQSDADVNAEDTAALRIVEPIAGERFVIDPDRDPALQSLQVTVVAPRATSEVILDVDGRSTARAARPFVFQWLLSAGHHQFVAKDARGARSQPVFIDVRAAESKR